MARLLGTPPRTLQRWVQAGFLDPVRGARGEYRFRFEDLVLLRAAQELHAAGIPPRRVREALSRLRDQLPRGRPLSSVRIAARGQQVVVRDGSELWEPESGQAQFDFSVAELAAQVRPLSLRSAQAARQRQEELDSEDWFDLAFELEATAPDEAADAYRRTLELVPDHADAHLNLGRLLHEERELESAERHYREALRARPGDATALFNLGVVLDDQARLSEAVDAYESAVGHDPSYADAHYNLSGLLERQGDLQGALRHLKEYKRLRIG